MGHLGKGTTGETGGGRQWQWSSPACSVCPGGLADGAGVWSVPRGGQAFRHPLRSHTRPHHSLIHSNITSIYNSPPTIWPGGGGGGSGQEQSKTALSFSGGHPAGSGAYPNPEAAHPSRPPVPGAGPRGAHTDPETMRHSLSPRPHHSHPHSNITSIQHSPPAHWPGGGGEGAGRGSPGLL